MNTREIESNKGEQSKDDRDRDSDSNSNSAAERCRPHVDGSRLGVRGAELCVVLLRKWRFWQKVGGFRGHVRPSDRQKSESERHRANF